MPRPPSDLRDMVIALTETYPPSVGAAFARLGDHHETGEGRTHWVVHEHQILGAAHDNNAWPGLERDCEAVPLPDVVACAPCMAEAL